MQILVLGMHRSGTSAVTRIVSMAGAYLGRDGVSTDSGPDNPRGFWEHRDVKRLNRQLMESLGMSWCRVSRFDLAMVDAGVIQEFDSRASSIVADLDQEKPWVVKDPRLSLLFPLWRPHLSTPLCILVHRSPVEIAASLRARNGFPMSFSIALWEKYAVAAINGTQGLPRLVVSMKDIITSPEESAHRLFQRLVDLGARGLRRPSATVIRGFIDPSLVHNRAPTGSERSYLNPAQQELFQALESGTVFDGDSYSLSSDSVETLRHGETCSQEAPIMTNKNEIDAPEMSRDASLPPNGQSCQTGPAQTISPFPQIAHLEERIHELECQLADSKEAAALRQAQLRELEEQGARRDVELQTAQTLAQRTEALEVELANQRTATTEAHESVARAENEAARVGRLATQHGARVVELEGHLAAQVDRAGQAEARAGRREQELEDVRQRLRSAVREAEELGVQVTRLQVAEIGLKDEVRESAATIAVLEADRNSMRADLGSRHDELGYLRGRGQGREAFLAYVQKQYEERCRRLAILDGRVTELHGLLRKKSSRLLVATIKAERLEVDNAALVEQVKDLLGRLEDRDARTLAGEAAPEQQATLVVQLQSEVERLHSDLDQATNARSLASEQVSRLERCLSRMRKKMKRAKSALRQRTLELTEQQEIAVAVRQELAQEQESRARLGEEPCSAHEQVGHLSRSVTQREEDISQHEQELVSNLSQELSQATNQVTFLQQQVRLLREWLDHISYAFRAVLKTRRWKTGNRLGAAACRLLGHPQQLPLIGQAESTLSHYENWKRTPPPPVVAQTRPGSTIHLGQPDLPETATYDVVMLANIDWDARYQRPQQIATQFAKHGHRVFYIVASDVLFSSAAGSYAAQQVADGVLQIRLSGPRQVDRYGEVLDRESLNSFDSAIDRLRKDYAIVDAVTQVQLPFWTPLAMRLTERRGWPTVYDCMDEWDGFPGIGAPLIAAEVELVERAALVTVTASILKTKWKPSNENCLLVRNAVDYDYFAKECVPNDLLHDVARPIIGYYGALADWVDFKLVSKLAHRRPDWQFVLIGDIFVDDLAGLEEATNVHVLGRRPYDEMPLFLHNFDVCIIPFVLSDVTHAVDPVKFYEFMSAGKPVVAAPLGELRTYDGYLRFAETVEEYETEIESALREQDPNRCEARRRLAAQHDWKHRYALMHEAIKRCSPCVSIIIVTYENVDLTRLCVESILSNTTQIDYEVILVDNASSDDTASYLREIECEHEHITVIVNSENRGFAAGNNQGLRIASGDYLLLLNNDTVVPRGWLPPLLKVAADEQVGLVGPMTNFVGNEAKLDVPYGSDLSGMQTFATQYMYDNEDKLFDIRVLAMFCVMMRRDVFETVGPLDEDYEIGMFEDDDYSFRMRQSGYRTVCVEAAFVHHFGQAAFKKLLETGEYEEIWAKNQAVFERKWGAWKSHQHRTPREAGS